MKIEIKIKGNNRIAFGIVILALFLVGGVDAAPLRQWASGATASSQYSTNGWSAMQATGAPNTFNYGDYSTAWAPALRNGGIQWIVLNYSKSIYATKVNIHETWGVGALIKVELKNSSGKYNPVWIGKDPNYGANKIVWTNISFAQKAYPTKTVRLFFNTTLNPYQWEEIDAVELVGVISPISCNISTIYGYSFNDANKNKIKDISEVGLSNWTINLKGYNTCTGTLVSTTIKTNSTGYFAFKNVNAGTYLLSEDFVLHWLPTTDTAYTLRIPSNSVSIRKDFGNAKFP